MPRPRNESTTRMSGSRSEFQSATCISCWESPLQNESEISIPAKGFSHGSTKVPAAVRRKYRHRHLFSATSTSKRPSPSRSAIWCTWSAKACKGFCSPVRSSNSSKTRSKYLSKRSGSSEENSCQNSSADSNNSSVVSRCFSTSGGSRPLLITRSRSPSSSKSTACMLHGVASESFVCKIAGCSEILVTPARTTEWLRNLTVAVRNLHFTVHINISNFISPAKLKGKIWSKKCMEHTILNFRLW